MKSVILLLVFASAALAAVVPSESFDFHLSLVENDVYDVFWKFDETYITFEVHAQTLGWVGFGISPTGGMAGADLVIGWVSNGQATFHDRYASGNMQPSIDTSQDWELLTGSESGSHTILKFRRALTNCDDSDLDFTANTMRLIFAYHADDPTDTSGVNGPGYHGANQRGSKSALLMNFESSRPSIPADALTWDMLNSNYSVPATDTTYYCIGYAMPNLTQKHHIIKVEPLIQTGHETLVHHIILYACYHDIPAGSDGQGSVCYSSNMPELDECTALLVSWAIGGTAYYFPEHVGFPIGEASSPTFLRMEIHYDNPDLLNSYVDSSGMRMTYTPTLRTHDAGVLETGSIVTPLHIIPPYATNFYSHGHCTSECLQEAMDASGNTGGIKLFSTGLHTHLVGVGVKVHHYRNGEELSLVDQDMAYDFNFQESRFLPNELTVLPGDHLMTECFYTTDDKTVATKGGLASTEEMCLAFLLYYPKINLTNCLSIPLPDSQLTFIDATGSYNEHGEYTVDTPAAYSGLDLEGVADAVDWSSSALREKYQTAVTQGNIFLTCNDGPTKSYSVDEQVTSVPTITSPLVADGNQCDGGATWSISGILLILAMLFHTLL